MVSSIIFMTVDINNDKTCFFHKDQYGPADICGMELWSILWWKHILWEVLENTHSKNFKNRLLMIIMLYGYIESNIK